MKPIVTDIYDFPTLIQDRDVYVDKTALLYRLISKVDGTLFFMARPRRFGKSLMISTLEQIFLGKRDLFKGLAIAKTGYDWEPHPVIHLDMSQVRASGDKDYERALCRVLQNRAAALGVDLSGEDNPSLGFGRLIETLSARGKKVVVLIDEYDAPIGGLLNKPELLEEVRTLLHDFYLALKIHSAHIRFLMMTGVSKFTKLSVFSGMNNLTDISMFGAYATLLGYTREEVERDFKPHIRVFADKLQTTPEDVVADLLDWYDSYRFSPESEVRVCNPVSVGRALQTRHFDAFWDATGNSSLIIERLRKARKTTLDLEGIEVLPERLDVCDAERLPMEPLLYQGGYLTIDHVEPSGLLVLRAPNREVRQALDRGYVASVMKDAARDFTNSAVRLMAELDEAPDSEAVIRDVLTAVFAMVPHEWKMKSEAEAKRHFLLFMRMAGAAINAEVESAKGRADAVLETSKAIYIFEFKYEKSAKAALEQCRDRDYAASYATDKRPVFFVGVNYDPGSRDLGVEVINATNEPVNLRGEPVNEPVIRDVLLAVRRNPGLRRPALLSLVDVSEATMKRTLARLIAAGRIEFRGASKNGGYYAR